MLQLLYVIFPDNIKSSRTLKEANLSREWPPFLQRGILIFIEAVANTLEKCYWKLAATPFLKQKLLLLVLSLLKGFWQVGFCLISEEHWLKHVLQYSRWLHHQHQTWWLTLLHATVYGPGFGPCILFIPQKGGIVCDRCTSSSKLTFLIRTTVWKTTVSTNSYCQYWCYTHYQLYCNLHYLKLLPVKTNSWPCLTLLKHFFHFHQTQ